MVLCHAVFWTLWLWCRVRAQRDSLGSFSLCILCGNAVHPVCTQYNFLHVSNYLTLDLPIPHK